MTFETLVIFAVRAFYAFIVAIFVLPFVAIIAHIVREFRRLGAANDRLLASAIGVDLPPGAPAEIAFVAVASSTHAVWLDLAVDGSPPRFVLDLVVDANGERLTTVGGPFSYDSDGDFQTGEPRVVDGSPFGMSLNNRYSAFAGGVRVRSVQRVAWFSPTLGAGVTVRAMLTPTHGTKFDRCRLLVTATSEPAG